MDARALSRRHARHVVDAAEICIDAPSNVRYHELINCRFITDVGTAGRDSNVKAPKHRILQLNCLFNNYNVFIPQPIVFGNIVMLNIKKPAQLGTIPTLRLEAERGLSLETSNFVT